MNQFFIKSRIKVGPFRRLGKSAQGGGSSGPTPGAMHLGVFKGLGKANRLI